MSHRASRLCARSPLAAACTGPLIACALGLAATGCAGDQTIELFARGAGGTAGTGGSGGQGPTPCQTSAQCAAPAPLCDPAGGVCVQCLGNGHCSGQICDPLTKTCVQCATPTDCNGPNTCDALTHECRPSCSGPEGCTTPDAPYCASDRGVCVQCLASVDCLEPDVPTCNVTAGRCAQCIDDSACSGETPHCAPTLGECVECVVSSDCPGGGICTDFACPAA
jgi:hypothetical protein